MRSASLESRRVELLDSVVETTYPPRMRLRRHAHASAYLCFVRDGAFSERQGRRVETYDRTWCVFRPANDEHANEFGEDGAVCVNIDVAGDWIRERLGVQSAFVGRIRGRVEDEVRWRDSASAVVIESLAAEMLAFAAQRNERAGRARWLERAQQLIEGEFASPLSLARIASAVDIHPVHLARQFRAAHGMTVGDYIREVRVAFARRQLTTTEIPIAEVALSAGFFDQSQLTRAFKRVTGRTPAAYRARRRDDQRPPAAGFTGPGARLQA